MTAEQQRRRRAKVARRRKRRATSGTPGWLIDKRSADVRELGHDSWQRLQARMKSASS